MGVFGKRIQMCEGRLRAPVVHQSRRQRFDFLACRLDTEAVVLQECTDVERHISVRFSPSAMASDGCLACVDELVARQCGVAFVMLCCSLLLSHAWDLTPLGGGGKGERERSETDRKVARGAYFIVL
jgi:hypothetical protein